VSEIQRRGGPQVDALLDRFGIQGPRANVPLVDTVSPVAVVPRLDPLCMAQHTIAAVASQFAHSQLFNPVGSGVILRVKRVWTDTPGAQFAMTLHNVALGAVSSTGAILNRVVAGQRNSSGQLRFLSTTSEFGTRIGVWHGGASSIASYKLEFDAWDGDNVDSLPTLGEGTGMICRSVATNQAWQWTWMWSERLNPDR